MQCRFKGDYSQPLQNVDKAVLVEDFYAAYGVKLCPTCPNDHYYGYNKIRRDFFETKKQNKMAKYKLKIEGNKIPVMGGKAFITADNVHMYEALIKSNEALQKHFVEVEKPAKDAKAK